LFFWYFAVIQYFQQYEAYDMDVPTSSSVMAVENWSLHIARYRTTPWPIAAVTRNYHGKLLAIRVFGDFVN
jgi:hypothetical protein